MRPSNDRFVPLEFGISGKPDFITSRYCLKAKLSKTVFHAKSEENFISWTNDLHQGDFCPMIAPAKCE